MPCTRGFDTAYGFVSGMIDYVDHIYNDYYDFYKCDTSNNGTLSFEILSEEKGIYSLYLYNRRVKQIVENHDTEKPLFLYLPMQSVHNVYYAPDKYYDCQNGSRCMMQAMLYAAEDLLEDIVEYFKEAGMWENTLMVSMY